MRGPLSGRSLVCRAIQAHSAVFLRRTGRPTGFSSLPASIAASHLWIWVVEPFSGQHRDRGADPSGAVLPYDRTFEFGVKGPARRPVGTRSLLRRISVAAGWFFRKGRSVSCCCGGLQDIGCLMPSAFSSFKNRLLKSLVARASSLEQAARPTPRTAISPRGSATRFGLG